MMHVVEKHVLGVRINLKRRFVKTIFKGLSPNGVNSQTSYYISRTRLYFDFFPLERV